MYLFVEQIAAQSDFSPMLAFCLTLRRAAGCVMLRNVLLVTLVSKQRWKRGAGDGAPFGVSIPLSLPCKTTSGTEDEFSN